MVKIKTRDKRIEEYNEKYATKTRDPGRALREYFSERGWNLEKASQKAKAKLEAILDQRQYEHIHIVMYEYPMKTDRPRSTMNGRFYSPNAKSNHKYFEHAVKQVCEDTLSLINTPAEIEIEAYLPMPSQVSPDEVILFEAKVLDAVEYPDYDNIGKCYTDMLNDTLIIDDDIFYRGEIRKYFSVVPRVEILIRYITKHESNYIWKKIKNRKSVKEAIEAGHCEIQRITI